MNVAESLLAELTQRGVELRADGDLLRYWPRRALTPGQVQRLREHKVAALELLRRGNGTRTSAPGDGSRFRFTDGLMDFGDVCAGWTPAAWAIELRRKAHRCEEIRPDIADYYCRGAADIEAKL